MPEPPGVIVFVQHLDDITAAEVQFIGPIGSIVVQRDDLEEEHGGGGLEREWREDTYY